MIAVTGAAMVFARLVEDSAGSSRFLPSGVRTNTSFIGWQLELVEPHLAIS